MKPAIVLNSLRAEGGPALAADLAAEWCLQGHEPVCLSLSGLDMSMRSRFEEIGVPVQTLGVDCFGPRHWPATVSSVRRALLRHRADSIVSIPTGVHGAIFLAARQANISKRVVHVGNYPWHWQDDFWKYKLTMQMSSYFTPDLVCVTDHVRSGVIRHFGRVAKRIHVVPNGINLEKFRDRGHRAIDGSVLNVIMVGRLDEGKDYRSLISAIKVLRVNGIRANLQICGDGSQLTDLLQFAASNDLTDSIRFLGVRSDINELLASADVFAFSVRPEEGLGIALIEAMASGLPVVATDVGACREVLEGGRAGRLVPENSPDAMAAAIASAPLDNDRRLAALERVKAVYSRKSMADGYGRLLGLNS